MHGSAKVHFGAHLCEVLKIRKELRDRNWHRPVDDDADRGGAEIVHHEHNRIREIGIGQFISRNEEDCS
jgi:hypothetical protein